MKELRVGLIGYKFMGKAHSHAFFDMPKFFKTECVPVLKAICGRTEEGVRKAAGEFGWQSYETDWKRLVDRDDIDLVDIATPNNTHKAIALYAAQKKKHILCEKPMAMSAAEAKEMLSAVKKAGVKHMVCFNYRRVPAIGLLKKLITDGRLGTIRHYRATYLQDWITDENFPLVWRLRKEIGGSGAHGDLNSHIIDLARYLVGEIKEVIGMEETFIRERYLPQEEGSLKATARRQKGKVTVDDACLFLAKFENGALGSFEATRFATGRRNYERIEINGSRGSAVFNFERMNELEFFTLDDPEYARGFRTILATEPEHPYMKAWWPPGHPIGYEHTFVNMVYDLCEAICRGRNPKPDFEDGLKCQTVLDAVKDSIGRRAWVKIT